MSVEDVSLSYNDGGWLLAALQPAAGTLKVLTTESKFEVRFEPLTADNVATRGFGSQCGVVFFT